MIRWSQAEQSGCSQALHRALAAWVVWKTQFISAFTVAEIERGVLSKERVDASQGAVLRRWFEDNVLPAFADRVVPFDLPAARILAGYRVPEHAPFDDALIAAVAESARMTVVTRNVRHFEPLGVPVLDPWATPRSDT